MLLNRLRPEIDSILRKKQNRFLTKWSTSGQILTIQHILKGAKSKNPPETLQFIDFSKAFDSILSTLRQYVKNIIMMYKNTFSMVHSPDRDWEFFNKVAGVIHGDTLIPFIFIICLDYVLQNTQDKNQDLGFPLTKHRSRWPSNNQCNKCWLCWWFSHYSWSLKGCNSIPS